MPIEAIIPRRLYRQVADQLRQLIDAGEFPVGSRLPPERDLALQLGISRPTVREALIALEVDGRVSIRVGSGIHVLPPPDTATQAATQPVAGPFEVLKARALIEGAIAEEAALIATPEALAPVDTAIAEMAAAIHPGAQSMAHDRAFHTAVADMLGNDAVTKVVGDLFDQRLHPYFAQLASYFEDAESWRAALAEHQAIRERLAAQDSAGARRAMKLHLHNSQLRFSKNFGEVLPIAPKQPGNGRPRQGSNRLPQPARLRTTTRNPIRRERPC
ncbi:MAG: FadR family transcriptional regulator [Beijerinckiaceae bacterium]|jgi:DNA-binding FadR family transcriptional regulator|nr:FadR family transcriptional regulator [Beijerinckiaceae bacterium]